MEAAAIATMASFYLVLFQMFEAVRAVKSELKVGWLHLVY